MFDKEYEARVTHIKRAIRTRLAQNNPRFMPATIGKQLFEKPDHTGPLPKPFVRFFDMGEATLFQLSELVRIESEAIVEFDQGKARLFGEDNPLSQPPVVVVKEDRSIVFERGRFLFFFAGSCFGITITTIVGLFAHGKL